MRKGVIVFVLSLLALGGCGSRTVDSANGGSGASSGASTGGAQSGGAGGSGAFGGAGGSGAVDGEAGNGGAAGSDAGELGPAISQVVGPDGGGQVSVGKSTAIHGSGFSPDASANRIRVWVPGREIGFGGPGEPPVASTSATSGLLTFTMPDVFEERPGKPSPPLPLPLAVQITVTVAGHTSNWAPINVAP
ncbi:MAG: hypothetical protein R3B13_26875 [Polyangiaceae bacterium]